MLETRQQQPVDAPDAHDWELIDDLLTIWRADPVAFFRECLGIEPWDHPDFDSQADIVRAPLYHRQISVRSGHKVSKTFTAAGLALWFYVCHDARVVLGAPTSATLRESTWHEVRRLVNRSRGGQEALYSDLQRVHGWSRERAEQSGLSVWAIPGQLGVTPDGGLRDDGRGAQIIGRTPNHPDAFSGISGPVVVYIVDEAAGVASGIFEAILGNAAGNAWVILIGNPTQTAGEFYDSHTTSTLYKTFHISSENVARYINPNGEINGLATLKWLEMEAEHYGVGSMVYDVRVAGEFPRHGLGVIHLGDVEAAQKRHAIECPKDMAKLQLHLGVDVADQGDDDTVITGRRGTHVFPQVEASGATDSVHVAGIVVDALRVWMFEAEGVIPGTHKPVVKIDAAGAGAGAAAILERRRDITVIRVNNANKPHGQANRELYENVRTFLWFAIRDFLRRGGTLPKDAQLRAQLLSPVYDYTTNNQYRVERKDQMKKRLGRSPDHAESLGYCIYSPPPNTDPRKPVTIRGL